MDTRHRRVCVAIVEEAGGLAHYAIGVRPHKPDGARRHGLRPFGRIAHHQHRLAERRRLLLYAPRVGEDDVGLAHEMYECEIVQGLDELDVGMAAKEPEHGLPHVRVQVYGVYYLHVLPRSDPGERSAYLLEPRPEVLPPVAGDQQQAAIGIAVRQRRPRAVGQPWLGLQAPDHVKAARRSQCSR